MTTMKMLMLCKSAPHRLVCASSKIASLSPSTAVTTTTTARSVRSLISSSSRPSSSLPFSTRITANTNVTQCARLQTKSTSLCKSQRRMQSSSSTSPSSSSSATTTSTSAAVSEYSRPKFLPSLEFVSRPKIRAMLPYIGHGGYLCLVSGFLMTDMLQLRLALVVGYTGLVTFHSLHAKPLKIPMGWSAVFVLVNAGAAVMLLVDQFGAPMTEEQEELYQQHFSKTLTKGQFYQLFKLAKKQTIPDGSILTMEGQVCPNLYFLLDGGPAKVFHKQTFASSIDIGGFVNDIAFQQQEQEQQTDNKKKNSQQTDQQGSYGTVITQGDCTVLIWNRQELHNYLSSRPELQRNMKYTLSEHLMKSLLKQREARHQQEQELQMQLREQQLQRVDRRVTVSLQDNTSSNINNNNDFNNLALLRSLSAERHRSLLHRALSKKASSIYVADTNDSNTSANTSIANTTSTVKASAAAALANHAASASMVATSPASE